MSNYNGAPLGIRDLAERLNTTPERLERLKARYEERDHYWQTIGRWQRKPKDWVEETRAPEWAEFPDDRVDFLKKSWVAKEKRIVLEEGRAVERYRVVLMSELEQMAREHLGVKGRGKPRVTIQLAALDDVFDEIQELCGKKAVFRRKFESGGGRGGLAKDKGGHVGLNKIAVRQIHLVDFVTSGRATTSNLTTCAENREKARQVARKERDARRAREKATQQRTN